MPVLPEHLALLQGSPRNPYSPFLSALCFGGSGSGRHGQGPSQRLVRLLPIEHAWNSILHCKGDRQALGDSQCLSAPGSAQGQRQSMQEAVSDTGLSRAH